MGSGGEKLGGREPEGDWCDVGAGAIYGSGCVIGDDGSALLHCVEGYGVGEDSGVHNAVPESDAHFVSRKDQLGSGKDRQLDE